ncbi:MAG: hypothetical protein Q7R54_02385 [bacterium]|nr:hypothetical protein [bacterium]
MTDAPITSRQKRRLRSFVYDTIDAAVQELRLSKKGFQNLLGHPDFKRRIIADVCECSACDPRYLFVKEFEITVPTDYVHDTRLDSFRAGHHAAFYSYNDAITDQNFSGKATMKLAPGRKLKVAVYDIRHGVIVTSDDNMKFIRSQNGILTGAHGNSLVWEQRSEELPKGRRYLSFDEKDVLWEDADGLHRVPSVDAFSVGVFLFDLGSFEYDWDDHYSLFVFRDGQTLKT